MTSKKKNKFTQIDLAMLARKHENNDVAVQEFDMRIDPDGTWFHQGGEIKRKNMVKLFASILTRLDDDAYWLITPVERGQIQVVDAPFFASIIDIEGEGAEQTITITTSLDDKVVLGEDHRIRVEYHDDDTPRPYVNIRGRLDALLARSVYYELAEHAYENEDGQLGVMSQGVFIPLE